MQHIQLLGAVHALILVAITWCSARRLTEDTFHRLSAVYLLAWCNLVYTALILSVFSRLDHVGPYFAVSIGLATGTELLLRFRNVAPLRRKAEISAGGSRFDRIARVGLGGILALAAVATALICIHYVPNNWDTCTYRLSRAFLYLAHGNLLHAGSAGDPRLDFYPFNGTLQCLFLSIYQLPARYFNLIPFLAWVFAGIGTFSLARSLGASRTGSFVAAWICLMSPGILAQAASGNDEVMGATPILIGLTFAREWFGTGKMRYALLAGIGLGLGLGTKLHWAFYWFFVCSAAILVAIRLTRRSDLRTLLLKRAPAVLAAAAISIPLIGAFLVCNYISSGQLTATAFNNLVLNTPFRFSLAAEKIQTSTGEMLLSPIPDLVPPLHPEQRQPAYAAFNKFFMRCCFSNLKETTKHTPEGYIFLGPADQYAYLPGETTVWLGFLPHLLLLVCLVQVFLRKLSFACIALVAAFFFWHLTYAVETRYIWWSCTYYSFPAVLAAAAIGPVWDFARRSHALAGRFLLVSLLAVFATHTLLASNLLEYSTLRNIQFVWRKGSPDPDFHAVEPSVVSVIQAAHRIYIPDIHWEILYWNFMRFNPAAKYTTGVYFRLPSPDTLMLLPIPADIGTGVFPVRLPDDTVPALTYVGEADHEHVFAQGDRVEDRYPDRHRYTFVQVGWRRDSSGAITGTQYVVCCGGLGPSSGISVRYELYSKITAKRLQRPWLTPGQSDTDPSAPLGDRYNELIIESRDVNHLDHVMRTTYELDQGNYVLGNSEGLYTAARGTDLHAPDPDPRSGALRP